jgi:nitrile hydratase accessory protein
MTNCNMVTQQDLSRIRALTGRSGREGDESFRLPWELRSFALGVAFYETGDFPWKDFQGELVAAIDASEDAGGPEQYYARWVEALEKLAGERGGFDPAELDRRTQEILATPRDNTHQHAHYDPITVPPGHEGPVVEPVQHGHDHDHD